jgi:GGDEF domain-containing protein
LSTTAAVVSVAAVALLFVALVATLLIAWRRRRADRAGRVATGAAVGVGSGAADTGAGPSIAPGSPTTAPGSPAIDAASGAHAATRAPADHGPADHGPAAVGPWLTTWPLASESWERAIRHEDDRLARYPHRAAVAIAELDGVDIVIERYGRPAEERLARAVEDTLRRIARSTDVVARIGRRRVAVLLVETDEGGAERYAHRVRLATDLWLEAVALPLRMRVAVADPPIGGTLATALETAESRLATERSLLDYERDRHETSHPPGRWSPGEVR